MRLELSRAESADFDVLVPMLFDAFQGDGGFYLLSGPKSAENFNRVTEYFQRQLSTESAIYWTKVTDEDAGGKVIAASLWKIYSTYVESEFDAKAAKADEMNADSVVWLNDERQK